MTMVDISPQQVTSQGNGARHELPGHVITFFLVGCLMRPKTHGSQRKIKMDPSLPSRQVTPVIDNQWANVALNVACTHCQRYQWSVNVNALMFIV